MLKNSVVHDLTTIHSVPDARNNRREFAPAARGESQESAPAGPPGSERSARGRDPSAPGRQNDLVAQAIRHVEMGFAVFAVWGTDANGRCTCPAVGGSCTPGKHPVPENGFKSASRDPREIRDLLEGAERNYGMVWPRTRGRTVFGMDIDGEDWRERIAALKQQLGPLPDTKLTKTPHGLHAFFEWPPDVGEPPTGNLFGFVVRWPDRGYVIGPGSHIGTSFYKDNGAEIARFPEEWARAALAARTQPVLTAGESEQVPEGRRHDYLRDRAMALRRQGLTGDDLFAAVWAINRNKCDPPKSRDGVRRAIGEVETRFTADPMTTSALDDDEGWVAAFGNEVVLDDRVPDFAFRGPIGEFAMLAARSTNAPALALLVTGLAAFGAMVGHGPRAIYNGARTVAQPWVLLVGATGVGKGLSMAVCESALDYVPSRDRKSVLTNMNSGEGLVKAMLSIDALRDGSVPALLVLEEFAGLLRVKEREGQTLGQMLRVAYDGRALTRAVAKEVIAVADPAIAVIAHVTPQELLRQASFLDAKGGFLNRFMPLPATRHEPLEPGGDIEFEAVGERIEEAVRYARSLSSPIPTSASALALFDVIKAWHREVVRLPGLVGSMLERTNQHIHRLALTFFLTRADLERPYIDAGDVVAAAAIASLSEKTVMELWAEKPANTRQALIVTKVVAAGSEGITPTQLLQMAGSAYRGRLREDIARMLDDGVLLKHRVVPRGWRLTCGTRSRPPSLWRAVVDAFPAAAQ
jgi:hypothetical protein